MIKVLVLGVSGMLGSTVLKYLKSNPNIYVKGTNKDKNVDDEYFYFDACSFSYSDLKRIYSHFEFEYIINCIGVINRYCRNDNPKGIFNAIQVNALFPHVLSTLAIEISQNIKIIQIATDCVYSGNKGNYFESSNHDAHDVYGKTKSLGEVIASNFLNIRCSIVGKEIKNNQNLLEWFLSHSPESQIEGYSHHYWNGVTTLQFSKFCEAIIMSNTFRELRNYYHVLHYVPNETVSKYELLKIFQEVFQTKYKIIKNNTVGKPVDRTLATKYLENSKLPMLKAIQEYYNFIKLL